MTTTTTSMPASTPGGTAVRTRRPVSQVSIAAGAATLAVIEAYGAIAHAAGVPLRAAAFGAHTATQVNAGWLALGVALGTFWGTVLAVVFARRAATAGAGLPGHHAATAHAVADRPADRTRHGRDQGHAGLRPPDRRRDHHPQ
jgi:hypothetical protein